MSSIIPGNSRRYICLIGYRGAGKTTVGRLLADRLSMPFADSDARIAERSGRSISDIFVQDGEAAFRELEREVLVELTRGSAKVISVGGGAMEDARNIVTLRQGGVVIWLTASPEVLWRRVAGDPRTARNRPPLTSQNGLEEIRQLLAERKPNYGRAADWLHDTNALSPEEVVEDVLMRLHTP